MTEHLSEATFLWKQWEFSLLAPDDTLSEVEEGDEARLLAHLEGLVLAGRRGAERLLLPALDEEDPAAVSAAASALLSAEDADWLDAVLARVAAGPGLLRALALSARADVGPALLRLLPGLAVPHQAGVLDVLRFRCVDASEAFSKLALDGEPALLRAAIRAARFAPGLRAVALLRRGFSGSEPSVRAAALETGLVLGLREAWSRCLRAVESGGPEARIALAALAAGGDVRAVEVVIAAAAAPDLRREAIWALGFSGRLVAAEFLARSVGEEDGRLVAESLAAITGLPLRPPFVLEAEDEDEAPASDETAAEDVLPGPPAVPGKVDAEAVANWWADARRRFRPEGRYLHGSPVSPEVVAAVLETVSMRRRPALCWELAIRSGGTCAIEPHTWARTQREQAKVVKALRPLGLTASFDRLLNG